jgi:hypothetical protein
LTSWQQQRSDIQTLVVTFDQPVTVTPADLVLTNLGVNAPVDPDVVVPIDVAQLSFSGNELTISFAPNSLADGVYQLEILDTAVNGGGLPLDGDGDGQAGGSFLIVGEAPPDTDGDALDSAFYIKTADWNADAGASIFDFPTFAYWFNAPTAPSYVDLNDDLGVTIFDFPVFQAVFSTGITFPPPGLAGSSDVELADRFGSADGESSLDHVIDRAIENLADPRQAVLGPADALRLGERSGFARQVDRVVEQGDDTRELELEALLTLLALR